MTASVSIAKSTSLVLSSNGENGAMAVLSGGNSKTLFNVEGEVVLVDLILEDGKTQDGAGAIYATIWFIF